MKKYLLLLLVLGVKYSVAQQKLIHYWHFNSFSGTYKNPGIPSLAADYSLLDTAKARVAYKLLSGASATYAGYIDNVTGDTTNARMGTAAGQGYRFRNPTDSAEIWIYMPTKNFRNIALKYASQTSSLTSGMLVQWFAYSTDSGLTWKTTGLNKLYDSASTAFKLTTINFGADSAVNNNSALVFRIRFAGNTTGTSGNNRFDNITVEGDTIINKPNGITLHTAAGLQSFPNPVVGRLTVQGMEDGLKTITVFSVSGQRMLEESCSTSETALNIASLPSGMYWVKITNTATGATQSLRFVKE